MGLNKSKKFIGVYYRNNKSGDITYYFTYKDENRKQTFQKVGTKSQGITERYTFEKRNETILKLKNGELPPLAKSKKRHVLKFDDVANFYFDNHKVRSTEKRKRYYKYRLEPYFGQMNFYNITVKHLMKFRDETMKDVSPQTTIMYLELMTTIFNYYIKSHNLKIHNPTKLVPRPKIDNRRERILSKKEINELFIALDGSLTLSLFCSLALCSAGRRSTILNYKVKDVDLEHNTINSFDFKNQSTYKSFLDVRTHHLIEQRIEQCRHNPEAYLVHRNDINDVGRWVSRELKIIFDILFNQGLDKGDIKNRVVIHSFRHTTLSHLGMNGVNSYLIQKISNHKSSKMVERYVKLDENSGKKEIQKLWG